MGRRPKVPSRAEHARLWARLDTGDRRRIMRAVNRGEGLSARRDARLAVGLARQQQRYWSRAWWFGPLVGVVLVPAWLQVLVAAVVGTAMMGAMSAWRLRRARACEHANLERLGAG